MIATSPLPLLSNSSSPAPPRAPPRRLASRSNLPTPRTTRRLAAVAHDDGGGGGCSNGPLPGFPAVEEDEELCPVDCVTEFKTEEEFRVILDRAKAAGALVVVDFYRTSCGSCKYIEQGFVKLCKGGDGGVVFLKHNVIDEYDEQSEVADRLRIKVVPLFHFYKDGVLVEAFPTRDKERIMAAIQKYISGGI